MSLEYVFSGPNYLRTMPSGFSKKRPADNAISTEAITRGISLIRDRCREIMGVDDLKTSILYNAYTEYRHGDYFRSQNNHGFDSIYADSGGLQVVTTGKKLTPDLKKKIYQTQKVADFGFCFDEIPLGIKEGVDQETGKHRSQTTSKLFDPSGFAECAEHTARNVKEQCEAFEGSDTKAFYILQGNKASEMYKWFRAGVDIIGEDGFKNIAGVAPADTCMGNGELESTDMLAAYHAIVHEFGEQYAKNHLHLLGVGSPSRLLPVMFMQESGFLRGDCRVSFDSSSSSMSMAMGNFMDSDGSRPNKKHDKVMAMFEHFYDDLGPLLEEYSEEMSRGWFMDHIAEHYKSISKLVSQCTKENEIAVRVAITLICVWQNIGFFSKLRKQMDSPEVRSSAIGNLLHVRDLKDYNQWAQQFSRFISSKRIDRKSTFTLDSLFD